MPGLCPRTIPSCQLRPWALPDVDLLTSYSSSKLENPTKTLTDLKFPGEAPTAAVSPVARTKTYSPLCPTVCSSGADTWITLRHRQQNEISPKIVKIRI